MAGKAAVARKVIPFTRAAHKHVEPMFQVMAGIVGAASQQFGPYSVPAYGYLRAIWLYLTCAGGVIGPGVLAGDGPWTILQDIRLSDVNGAPIFGPGIDGYDLYLIDRYGGYRHDDIPDGFPDATLTGVNPAFALRVPVEIDHSDGYGALANQNAAQAYQLSFTIATEAQVFSTAPTTDPTPTIYGAAEMWSQPAETDSAGNPQQLSPPGHGTTQFWSKYVKGVNAGANTILLPRVGNLLRNVILAFYNDSAPSVRITSEIADPMQLVWDSRILLNERRAYRRDKMKTDFGQYGYTIPEGVLAYDFDEDGGGPGDEHRNLWLPTVQATRLEFVGAFTGTGGTLRILTNDVAPAIPLPQAPAPVQGT